MVSKLIEKNGEYVCSNCLMRQPKNPDARCKFCGYEFSNYESHIEEQYHEDSVRQQQEMNIIMSCF